MAYITAADITDSMLKETGLSTQLTAKLLLVDAAVNDMAERKGVDSDNIETAPLHNLVLRFAVAWVCMELCKDLIGKVKLEMMDNDIYYQKHKVYKADVADLDSQITPSVLTGEVDEMRDRQGPRVGILLEGG